MIYEADFLDGELRYQERERKPRDLSRYQTAMFLDRPDLWPTKPRRKSPPALPDQHPLFPLGED